MGGHCTHLFVAFKSICFNLLFFLFFCLLQYISNQEQHKPAEERNEVRVVLSLLVNNSSDFFQCTFNFFVFVSSLLLLFFFIKCTSTPCASSPPSVFSEFVTPLNASFVCLAIALLFAFTLVRSFVCFFLFICLFNCLSVCLFTGLFVCVFVYLLVCCLFVCSFFVCLCVYLLICSCVCTLASLRMYSFVWL